MADEEKKPEESKTVGSADAAVKYVREELVKSFKAGDFPENKVTKDGKEVDENEAKRNEALEAVIKALEPALKSHFGGNNKDIALDKNDILKFADQIYSEQKIAKSKDVEWDGKVEADNPMTGGKERGSVNIIFYNVIISSLVDQQNKINEEAEKVALKLGDSSFGDRVEAAGAAQSAKRNEEFGIKIAEHLISEIKAKRAFVEKFTKDMKEVSEKVPADKVTAIQGEAGSIAEKISSAIKARLELQNDLAAYEKLEADKKKKEDKDALDARATKLKEEEGKIAEAYKKARTETFKDSNEQKALDYILRNAISDKLAEVYKDEQVRDARVSKALKDMGALGDVGKLVGQNGFEASAGVPTKSELAAGGAKMGTTGRVVAGIAGAAALAATAALLKSGGGTEEVTGPDGKPQTVEKESSTTSKVFKVVGSVVLVAATVLFAHSVATGKNPWNTLMSMVGKSDLSKGRA